VSLNLPLKELVALLVANLEELCVKVRSCRKRWKILSPIADALRAVSIHPMRRARPSDASCRLASLWMDDLAEVLPLSADGANVRVVRLRSKKAYSTHYTLFELLPTQISVLPVICRRTLN
jgi:hypothetical protein